ncbi:hypothetical protein ERO13_D02G235600v2 [Gossypium hirsutum]|uniref:Uncharacterized protein n=6 Tax=Gossypium TaxID=3633 RepID=A0A0D2RLQ9_GOSRA|nr:hypothetical protein ES319_D02G268500v1 [Gossypium barbadense]KAG4160403.1 hypothetical protein ERO13_D02G235600v2 [Gossypium hirsutum]KJB32824.1 hypothetical protein B456_005G263700 [Gossypium raimondii]TYG81293.1 hypothetical protein ES288_D02G287600v1 [Gossypium darwinii]TYH85744.1 hypothetical protein ES332_D02G290500v1 [Gossypium tomentosum]TYI95383.1 hypothetical protein E1A91_D02G276200v1 [Gossypium mustelinum]
MSAIVGVWMDEIEKLKERVQAKRWFMLKAKKDEQLVKERHVEEEKEAGKETIMSEATLCMLMDRFVPC